MGVCGGSNVSWKRQFYKCQSVWQAIISLKERTQTVGRAPQSRVAQVLCQVMVGTVGLVGRADLHYLQACRNRIKPLNYSYFYGGLFFGFLGFFTSKNGRTTQSFMEGKLIQKGFLEIFFVRSYTRFMFRFGMFLCSSESSSCSRYFL